MTLRSSSTPRWRTWRDDYPYLVRPVGYTLDGSPCNIHVCGEQDFEFVVGWQNSEGRIFTRGMDTKSGGGTTMIGIEADEKWELNHDVRADNAKPICVTLEIYVENGALMEKTKV